MTDELVGLEAARDDGAESAGVGQRSPVPRPWSLLTGDETFRPLTVIAWSALVVLMCIALFGTLAYDFRDHDIRGDQASHVFTTLSLVGPGHNLSYNFSDLEQFDALNWMPKPYGLFFQRYGDGWAYAKPYGYALYASPFAWWFGTTQGIAVANTVLLLVLTAASVVMLRLRYHGPVVPVTVGAFVFLGLPYFYGYVLHPDLMIAVLTAIVFLLVLVHWKTKQVAYAVGAGALSALLVAENPRALALILPAFVVVLWELRSWRKRVVVVAVVVVALGVVIAPNLYYSDGASWSAYTGERYQAVPSLGSHVPFDGIHVKRLEGWRRVHTGHQFSGSNIVDRLTEDPEGGAKALYYYFFGRHTGMLVFVPVGFLILVLVLARARKLDLHAWSIFVGVAGYIIFYSFAFSGNYYGGGQSLGNRYFLQVSPSLLALAVAAQLRVRALAFAAIAGGVLAIAFMFPHFEDPSGAYPDGLARTSWLQRQLPFETGIAYAEAFQERTR